MEPLGIERLGTFGMPPVEFVTLAADLGCDRTNVVSVGREMAQAIDGFAALAELAAARDLKSARNGLARPARPRRRRRNGNALGRLVQFGANKKC